MYAVALGHGAEKFRVERRVQLVSVVQPVARQVREAAAQRRSCLNAIVVQRRVMTAGQAIQPKMLESGGPVIFPGGTEAVQVAVADRLPVVEADAELERRLSG